jgi:hypothetical protein
MENKIYLRILKAPLNESKNRRTRVFKNGV